MSGYQAGPLGVYLKGEPLPGGFKIYTAGIGKAPYGIRKYGATEGIHRLAFKWGSSRHTPK